MVAFPLLTTLVTALVATQQASANPAPSTLPTLLARQLIPANSSQVPALCQSSCAGALADCGGGANCSCNDQTVNDVASCLSCFINITSGGYDGKAAQNFIDEVVNGCTAAGKPVKAVTLSTGNGGVVRIGFGSMTRVFALAMLGAVVLSV